MTKLARRRAWPLVAALLVLSAPSVANASVDHWFSGQLEAGFGWGSTSAHSYNFVEGDAYNDLICIGLELGHAGSYYDAPSYGDCQQYSSGGIARAWYSPTCCYHATVIYGGPASSKTILSGTHANF
jgi:hypothetical protein